MAKEKYLISCNSFKELKKKIIISLLEKRKLTKIKFKLQS